MFNGVDVLLFAAIILAVIAGRWCLRRGDTARQQETPEAIVREGRERVRLAYEQTAAEWNATRWPRLDREREAA